MPELDFIHYHQQTLPDLLAQGRAELLHHQRLPTLGILIAGQDQSFSYQLDESGISIHRGTEKADLCVELSMADWRGLVTDLETVPSILYGDRLVSHSGEFNELPSVGTGLACTLYGAAPVRSRSIQVDRRCRQGPESEYEL